MTDLRNLDATCETCPYWCFMQEQGTTRVGQCRISPPRGMMLIPMSAPTGKIINGGRPEMAQGFTMQPDIPMTPHTHWCGEHPEFLPEGQETDD